MATARMQSALRRNPYLVVDQVAGTVEVTDRDGVMPQLQNVGMFGSKVLMDLEVALSHFELLVRDRQAFTIHELATIAGVQPSKVNHWTTEQVVRHLQQDSDQQVKTREYICSEAFVASVCGALRRQGLELRMLRLVSTELRDLIAESVEAVKCD